MIAHDEFEKMMNHAKHNGDLDKIKLLLEIHKSGAVDPPSPYGQSYPDYAQPKLALEPDIHSHREKVMINVQVMVENLLGGRDPNRDVQVVLEKYGHTMGVSMIDDSLAFVVINMCNIKTGQILTLRETYGKFPSSELLTKLELLRVGGDVT